MAPDVSIRDRLASAKAARDAVMNGPGRAAPGGGGPGEPPEDERLSALEKGLEAVTASIRAIELSQARMEALAAGFATKADIATLKGSVDTATARIDAQTSRINALETANTTTINTALGKTIGVPGAIGLFVSLAAIVTAAIAALRYLHVFP